MDYEQPEVLSPVVTRVLANNPGVYTGPGTNTYVVGTGPVAVIDAGPDDEVHLAAVEAAIAGRPVAAVLCTHHHIDHSPGTVPLARRVGAPVLARRHELGPEIDRELDDLDEIEVGGASLTAVLTPGHASDHVCFFLAAETAVFSGDHIMGGSTVVIRPPDGHMDTYIASLRRMLTLEIGRIYPGHGPVIEDGTAEVEKYLAHREERRLQVAARLAAGDTTIDEIVAAVYAGVPGHFHPIARHTVQAHLHQLADQGGAVCDSDPMDLASRWRAVT